MSNISNKDVKAEGERLESIGYQFEGYNGKGHLIFRHDEYGTVHLPSTPSDWRWVKNGRSEIARQMKMTLRQVEDMMGVPRRRSGRTRAVAQNKTRQNFITRIAQSSAKEKPAPVVLPTTEERMEQIHEEMEEALVRQQLSIPGSSAYRDAMGKIARLRSERIQLVADEEAA